MSKEIKEFYITHLVPDNLPEKGLRKLLFYTATLKSYNEGLYYWGLDIKNPFDENYMKQLEKGKKIIRILPGPIKVKKGEGIWLDSQGNVFKGDLKNPYANRSS